ncbi:MAG: hypothetical protein WCG85_20865 [Polyangia bacterium]
MGKILLANVIDELRLQVARRAYVLALRSWVLQTYGSSGGVHQIQGADHWDENRRYSGARKRNSPTLSMSHGVSAA